jgi:hypothetical protein
VVGLMLIALFGAGSFVAAGDGTMTRNCAGTPVNGHSAACARSITPC